MIQVRDTIQPTKTSRLKNEFFDRFYFFLSLRCLDMAHDVQVKSPWLQITRSVVLESRRDSPPKETLVICSYLFIDTMQKLVVSVC